MGNLRHELRPNQFSGILGFPFHWIRIRIFEYSFFFPTTSCLQSQLFASSDGGLLLNMLGISLETLPHSAPLQDPGSALRVQTWEVLPCFCNFPSCLAGVYIAFSGVLYTVGPQDASNCLEEFAYNIFSWLVLFLQGYVLVWSRHTGKHVIVNNRH